MYFINLQLKVVISNDFSRVNSFRRNSSISADEGSQSETPKSHV